MMTRFEAGRPLQLRDFVVTLMGLVTVLQLPHSCWSLVTHQPLFYADSGSAGVVRCATAPRTRAYGRRFDPCIRSDTERGRSHQRPFFSLGAGQNSGDQAPEDEEDDSRDSTSSYSSPGEDPPPVVKRPGSSFSNKAGSGKKSKKEYRVLDNRDSLPFSVQLATPDPYTPPDAKKVKGRATTPRRRNNAVENKISSQLFMEGDSTRRSGDASSDATKTLLGEYQLDKHTTTGDVLLIGDSQYKVVSHRCLYKYAGGQRFVMVRKILHVKEVGRWQAEEYLQRQWRNSPPSVGSAGEPPLELH
jgi:hypothetical protein